ncbi:MAG: YjhX family toxin [Pseudomonadota bacterium]
MNISRTEQKVLHALALGGRIEVIRAGNGRVTEATCFTREGYGLEALTLDIFRKLRRKGLIESRAGAPYRISHLGRMRVAARPDNRG